MKKLFLVDGHSLIHRAYHAYPRTLATAKGELTNAVYGFTNILLTAVNELSPTHAAVAFDLPKPTFREQMFVGYKQSRVKPDDDMLVQIPRIKEIVAALNIPIYEVAGYEADDVIGTLANQAVNQLSVLGSRLSVTGQSVIGQSVETDKPKTDKLETENRKLKTDNRVIVLTSDRDLMQLIRDDKVVVKLPPRGTQKRTVLVQQGQSLSDIWNEDKFTNGWGFSPKLLPDYKALAGDQSDDIPGVRGIGEKTAKNLVAKFGSIDNLYRGVSLLKQGDSSSEFLSESVVAKLADGYDMAVTSKKLATIDTAVPIKLDWKQTEIHQYDKQKVLKLFDELQFRSLIKKLPNDKFEQAIQDVLF